MRNTGSSVFGAGYAEQEVHEMSSGLLWFFIGLVLILLEFAIPGLVVIFFGVGAWAVALLLAVFPIGVEVQLFVFLIVSVLSLVTLRRYVRRRDDTDEDEEEDMLIGRIAEVSTAIRPDKAGTVFIKGTLWRAESAQSLAEGEKVEIIEKEGLVVTVKRV